MEERIREGGAIFNHGNTECPDCKDDILFRLPNIPFKGAEERQARGRTGKRKKIENILSK